MRFSNLVPFLIKFYLVIIVTIVTVVVGTAVYMMPADAMTLMQTTKKVMQMSCQYFQKETYRTSKFEDGSTRRFGNTYQLIDYYGNPVPSLSGQFYIGNSATQVFQNLFIDNTCAEEYITWLDEKLDDKGFDPIYIRQGQLYITMKNMMTPSDESKKTGLYSLGGIQEVTPGNLAFTYLDKNTLTKIFTWNLVNTLSASGLDIQNFKRRPMLVHDAMGRNYLRWKGFRIYYEDINIDVSRRLLFDLLNPDDIEEYQNWTNIDVVKYVEGEYTAEDSQYREQQLLGAGIQDNDIRKYKIVYDIGWSIPIAYEGILPLWLVMHQFNADARLDSFTNLNELIESGNQLSPWVSDRDGQHTTMEGDIQNGNEIYFAEGRIGNIDGAEAYNTTAENVDNFRNYQNYKGEYESKAPKMLGLAQRTHFTVFY